MSPDAAVADLLARFADTVAKASGGERAIFVNPGARLPNGGYFATVKDRDGANDRASALSREGVWRLSIGVPVPTYERLFGPRPGRPAKGAAVETGHDFTRLDLLTPHPVYAWMGWIAVLNPGAGTYETLTPHLAAAYDKARAAVARRTKRAG